jgi:hypothetical protein
VQQAQQDMDSTRLQQVGLEVRSFIESSRTCRVKHMKNK